MQNAIYNEVPFLGVYRFKPMPFEAAAIGAIRPYMVSEEFTFINFAVYMLRQHNKGKLSEGVAKVQRAKKSYYNGIFKDYAANIARHKARPLKGVTMSNFEEGVCHE